MNHDDVGESPRVDISPQVVRFNRRPPEGLLGGGLVAAVLGLGALWQAVTNHVLTSTKGSSPYYLPTGLRILMGVLGVGLTAFALLAALMVTVFAAAGTSLKFSTGSLTVEARDLPRTSVRWDAIAAIRLSPVDRPRRRGARPNRLHFLVRDPQFVARYAHMASLPSHTTEEGTWYEIPYDLGKKATKQIRERLHDFRPGLPLKVEPAETGLGR